MGEFCNYVKIRNFHYAFILKRESFVPGGFSAGAIMYWEKYVPGEFCPRENYVLENFVPGE